MHPVILYTIVFILLGGAGMAAGNRKVSPDIQQQRWLKYGMYIFIISLTLTSIFFHFFFWLAICISVAGTFEIVWVNFKSGKTHYERLIFSGLIYLLIASGFLLFGRFSRESFILYIYFQVIVFDGFSQISGQLFGKHPLAPVISPSKTAEGLAGGIIFCVLAAWLVRETVPMHTATAVFFGFLTAILSFAGDMLASWFKRITGVKDYSRLLPGQGGFLDRFDSFLMSGAVYYMFNCLLPLHLN